MNEQRDKLKELLRASDRVPPAPDCRDAVMAGIAPQMGYPRLRWAYALAGLLIVLGVGARIVLRPTAPPRRSIVVKKAPQAPRQPSPQRQIAQKPSVAEKPALGRDFRIPAPRLKQQRDSEIPRLASGWRFPKASGQVRNHHPERRAPVDTPQAQPKPSAPEVTAQDPAAIDPDKKPVALVMVTFPSGETTTDKSYEYTNRNVETGEVTKCSVTRTGDSIEIHLETTQGEEPRSPVKGCVDYEKKSNA